MVKSKCRPLSSLLLPFKSATMAGVRFGLDPHPLHWSHRRTRQVYFPYPLIAYTFCLVAKSGDPLRLKPTTMDMSYTSDATGASQGTTPSLECQNCGVPPLCPAPAVPPCRRWVIPPAGPAQSTPRRVSRFFWELREHLGISEFTSPHPRMESVQPNSISSAAGTAPSSRLW